MILFPASFDISYGYSGTQVTLVIIMIWWQMPHPSRSGSYRYPGINFRFHDGAESKPYRILRSELFQQSRSHRGQMTVMFDRSYQRFWQHDPLLLKSSIAQNSHVVFSMAALRQGVSGVDWFRRMCIALLWWRRRAARYSPFDLTSHRRQRFSY
jgi:hypothetical protein